MAFLQSKLAKGADRSLLVAVGWLFLAVLLGAIGVGCGTSPSGSPLGNATVQLWAADTKNNRMLGYQASPKNGDPAVVVIGQPAFGLTACNSGVLSGATLCGPIGAAVDANGNLWVADTGNNRVLEFTFPFRIGQPAALVIGQPGFATSGPCTPSVTSICGPRHLAFHQGDLWVSDADNNRVLEFQPPFLTGMPATLVLGQPNFTRSVCTDAPPTAVGMCSPSGLAFDSKGNLFVSDGNNSRVMMFSPPFSIGMPATLAIGQPDLLRNNQLPPSQSSLSSPSGLSVDGRTNNLYVADSGNSRIMIFPPPTSSGENACAVLGNNNFTTINPNQCGPPPNGGGTAINGGTICHPLDVKVDGAGNVVVPDQNNRTLIFGPIFCPPIATGEFASVVLGQPNLSLQIPPTGLATSQNDPGGVAVSGIIITP